MEYLFTLSYQLPSDDHDKDVLLARLVEAGCGDALVGLGRPGRVALVFTREGDSAEAAMESAMTDVHGALPDATLIEVRDRVERLSPVR